MAFSAETHFNVSILSFCYYYDHYHIIIIHSVTTQGFRYIWDHPSVCIIYYFLSIVSQVFATYKMNLVDWLDNKNRYKWGCLVVYYPTHTNTRYVTSQLKPLLLHTKIIFLYFLIVLSFFFIYIIIWAQNVVLFFYVILCKSFCVLVENKILYGLL